MLCDRLCTDDRESRHTELAEPGTSVYSAGTGMETGNLGTVSTEHFRSIMVCNCSSVLLLSIGTSLERTIGTFKYTLYILSGVIFTILGAFILYFLLGGNVLVGNVFSTYYISLSTFLAYAMCYPDMQVLLMFIIPVKMKWMAIFYVVIVVYEMIQYVMAGAWYLVIPIVASLLNFIIFYFGTKDFSRYNPKEIHRRNEFRRAMEPQGRMKSGSGSVTKHKCAICGRTELDDPNLEFRFCSRCNGNYEYCQDHLFTHTHVK